MKEKGERQKAKGKPGNSKESEPPLYEVERGLGVCLVLK